MEVKIVLSVKELRELLMGAWVDGWRDYSFSIDKGLEKINDNGKIIYADFRIDKIINTE